MLYKLNCNDNLIQEKKVKITATGKKNMKYKFIYVFLYAVFK